MEKCIEIAGITLKNGQDGKLTPKQKGEIDQLFGRDFNQIFVVPRNRMKADVVNFRGEPVRAYSDELGYVKEDSGKPYGERRRIYSIVGIRKK